jgi:hypothetical protein
VRRLIPWALVTVLALGSALTVVVTEARKTPASLTELKAAQLSPSELGKGWKVEHVKAATAPATFFRTCPGSPTFGGSYSGAGFSKDAHVQDEAGYIHDVPSSLQVLIIQPSAGAQGVYDRIVRCTSEKGIHPVTSYRTSAFDGLAQASSGVIYPLQRGSDDGFKSNERSIYGFFVQGSDLVTIVYIGLEPLSQVRQWAAEAVDKAAAKT